MKRLLSMIVALAFLGSLSSAAFADAAADWGKHCKSCHGDDGKGDTKMGKKLEIRDLTDPKVQAAFTDEQAIALMTDGKKGDDGKWRMPSVKAKLSADQMKALVTFVRAFKK